MRFLACSIMSFTPLNDAPKTTMVSLFLYFFIVLYPNTSSGATSKFVIIVPLSVYVRLLGQVTSWEKLFCSLQRILCLSHIVLSTFSCILCFSCVIFCLVRGILCPLLICLHTIVVLPLRVVFSLSEIPLCLSVVVIDFSLIAQCLLRVVFRLTLI